LNNEHEISDNYASVRDLVERTVRADVFGGTIDDLATAQSL
jgi:hypothetical protein